MFILTFNILIGVKDYHHLCSKSNFILHLRKQSRKMIVHWNIGVLILGNKWVQKLCVVHCPDDWLFNFSHSHVRRYIFFPFFLKEQVLQSKHFMSTTTTASTCVRFYCYFSLHNKILSTNLALFLNAYAKIRSKELDDANVRGYVRYYIQLYTI